MFVISSYFLFLRNKGSGRLYKSVKLPRPKMLSLRTKSFGIKAGRIARIEATD